MGFKMPDLATRVKELKKAIGGNLHDGMGEGLPSKGVDSLEGGPVTFQAWAGLTKAEKKDLNVQLCTMEAVAWVAGETISDHPKCACPILTDICVSTNDSVDGKDRRKLLEVVPLLVGSRVKGAKRIKARKRAVSAAIFEIQAKKIRHPDAVTSALVDAARKAIKAKDVVAFEALTEALDERGEVDFSYTRGETPQCHGDWTVEDTIALVKTITARKHRKPDKKAKVKLKSFAQLDDTEKRAQLLELK